MLVSLALVLGMGPATTVYAQDKPAEPPKAAQEAKPQDKPAEKPPEKSDWEKKIDGFTKLDGPITLYRKVEADKDTIYAELKKDDIGKLWMLQATASTGTVGAPIFLFQGAPLTDIVFRPTILPNDRVALVEPRLDVRPQPNTPMERVVKRGFPDSNLTTFKIEARNKETGSVLIDISGFLRSDIAQLGTAFPQGSYSLEGNETYVDSLKTFPENIVVRTVCGFRKRNQNVPGPASVPVAVSYNLIAVPQTDYVPRYGDSRVGYFTVDYTDPTDNASRDQNRSYILRWDLRKKDPSAAISEPVKPITWWISNDVPLEYRQAVREGLLMYNRAFEAAGFKNAIVVKQMPDDADWDIADVRYNIIRWTSNMPFAIALFRANPLTGEIINAAINMDAVFVRGGQATEDFLVDPTRHDHEKHDHVNFDGRYMCDRGHRGAADARFAQIAVEMLFGAEQRHRVAIDYVREVVAHEFGHIVGLRHNFIASAQFGAKELSDPKMTDEHGVTSTVMEYTPFNIFSLRTGSAYYSRTVGRYDIWAVKYGYTPIPGVKSPEDEIPTLRRWAMDSNKPEHRWESDSTADQSDPYVTRFDLGADPIEWCARVISTSRTLLSKLGDEYPKNGNSYFQFTERFNSLTNQWANGAFYATGFIGGIRYNNAFKGTSGNTLPVQPVPADVQVRALRLLIDNVFAENAISFPKSYYAMLTPNPNVPGMEQSAGAREFPVYDRFRVLQSSIMRSVFDADAQRRIVNNEFRSEDPNKTLTLARLYRSIGSAVWTELGNGRSISTLRRQLQRDHLSLMIDYALRRAPVVDDGRTLAWEQLRSLRTRLRAALPKAKGEYDRAHIEESLMRVNKAFDAQLTSG